jgi:hypothetical protein
MSFISTYAYRWFGIFELSRQYIRSRWVEISYGFGIALALINWSEGSRYSLHIRLGWPNIFIKLPFRSTQGNPDYGSQTWGFSLHRYDGHFSWGNDTKIIHWPWSFDHYRTSYVRKDGSWNHDLASEQRGINKLGRDTALESWKIRHEREEATKWSEDNPYRYVLKSGEVQDRIATICVEEREWRRRWLPFTKLFRKVSRTISVQFNDEVGERSGSWKGGCIGSSYEMRQHETPVDCLRRMERERKF